VLAGGAEWQAIEVAASKTYPWEGNSSYVCNPPGFENIESGQVSGDIVGARILALFLDSITSDHISPAGSIRVESPAGQYLRGLGISPAEFNQYSTRRGNHEVMMRGTFANTRLKNQMVSGKEGGFTVHWPSGDLTTIFDAALRYKGESVPLVIFAGKEYGTGSSRDSAAKGPKLLGVRAVIAESFERIHRSNLVGVGILPLMFEPGTNWKTLRLTGAERVTIRGLSQRLSPHCKVTADIAYADGSIKSLPLICCLDTAEDVENYKPGGILKSVLRHLHDAHTH
jgi:aconitate hydratase